MIKLLRGLWLCAATLFTIVLAFMLVVTPVAAHDGVPSTPYELARAWRWDPLLLLGLVFISWLYSQGVKTLWWRAGVGQGITHWQALAFNGGLTVLLLAFVSPLGALSNHLFAAHMVQHLLLLVVAAPLLVVGSAPQALTWAFSQFWRRRLAYWWRRQNDLHVAWQFLIQPRVTWGLHLGMLWVWQIPYVYKVALQDPIVHIVQHGMFLGAALLFWGLLLRTPSNGLPSPVGLWFILTTALCSVVLSIGIAFSPLLWHFRDTPAYHWYLTPLADQRLAGLILGATMGTVYLGVTWIFWRSGRREGGYTKAPVPAVSPPERAVQPYTAEG
ncbi:MAG: cytochrome c oxidase assembly protein [Caldilineaceae bacterium]